ncbi:MAG: selenium-dependent xanthine dehydrogenase [Oscillospiraceae bacterium]|nr:selenium-dependent xanthine dehydrogenase [Oscillospiraceae bacterium]
MVSLKINGKKIECSDENKRLIDLLRDDLRFTSVKEGCGEGACGTCMIIIDGKASRACIHKVGKLGDKNVQTVEGLSVRERDVYSYAFAKTGAVQCGFCIPGMVISAKALLDVNSSPTRADVKKAIHGNICRCTGYIKIEEAIQLAADFFREGRQVPKRSSTGKLGESLFRVDADEKTLGTGLYTDDMVIDDMVYAKALRTKYPRARVISIDKTKAEAHSDCIKIITAQDIPGDKKCGHLVKDWDALISTGDITRYVGDALCVAVAEKAESLDEILSLITVEYEILKPLSSPLEALREDAPKIHESGNILSEQRLKRGDADAAIAASKFVVTNHYSLPFTEHAFMEPECAIAMPQSDGLLLYTGSQSVYDEQREISGLLGIAAEQIHIRGMLVGGGFGGKEDMSVQHHAALAAWLTKRPVKVKFSRAESLLVHPKRHAMEIDFTTACDENGTITAVKAEIIADTGAYASLGGPVLQRSCTHAGGPYNFQNIDVKGTAVYTNNPPAGAFRGFGVPQSCFAMENNLNELAKKLSISAWEIRYRNAIKPGQQLPNGQIADESTSLAQCLLAVKDAFEASSHTGIACGFKNSGLGVGVPDISRCIISVEDGKIHVRSSAACIGQGMATVLTQMVCETIGISADMVVVEPPDTTRTPNAGTTTASRQTLFSGEAAIIAARNLLEALGTVKKPYDFTSLEGQEFYGEYNPHTDPMGSDKPHPVSHVAYGYATQVAQLDEEGKLIKITAAYDLGTVVNPKAAEGQIEGGVLMGVGYALTEDFPVESCYPTAKYGTLGLIRATAAPEIETILIDTAKQHSAKPAYGAKGVGELATIPTAPAISGALYKMDGVLRKKLPMKG